MYIYLKLLTPATALITTGFAEIIIVLCHYIYARKNMKLNIEIISKRNTIYFILGLLFIPISLIIRSLNLGFITTLALIIMTCSIMYFIVLYIKKDNNLLFILDKLKRKLKVG